MADEIRLRRPVFIANEIRLKRSHHPGAFLVLEGRDDRLLNEVLTDRGACQIVVGEGKERVLDIVSILEHDGFPGVLGLVDADFDRINGVAYGPNVVVTDGHDLESM